MADLELRIIGPQQLNDLEFFLELAREISFHDGAYVIVDFEVRAIRLKTTLAAVRHERSQIDVEEVVDDA